MSKDDLLEKAIEVRSRAHAPYSEHPVGAALRTMSGKIYVGCNVENAAYPEGICAEASAIAAMVTGGDTQIAEIVVVGPGEVICTPCGGCRQKIREFAAPDIQIHAGNKDKILKSYSMESLLPDSFGPKNLG
ncbi:MAG: cytidine deaminase [Alphaproteobacteria bacterium]|nr:MAG: cytidine deaminase [Alphaproteobacteria bacterium]